MIDRRRTSGAPCFTERHFTERPDLTKRPAPPARAGAASAVVERLEDFDGPASDLPWPSPSYKGAGHLFFFDR